MNDTTTSHHKSTPGAKASLNTALSDVVQGFLAITHNSVALLGTVLAVGLITLAAFAIRETRARAPMIDVRVLRIPAVSATALASNSSTSSTAMANTWPDLPKASPCASAARIFPRSRRWPAAERRFGHGSAACGHEKPGQGD